MNYPYSLSVRTYHLSNNPSRQGKRQDFGCSSTPAAAKRKADRALSPAAVAPGAYHHLAPLKPAAIQDGAALPDPVSAAMTIAPPPPSAGTLRYVMVLEEAERCVIDQHERREFFSVAQCFYDAHKAAVRERHRQALLLEAIHGEDLLGMVQQEQDSRRHLSLEEANGRRVLDSQERELATRLANESSKRAAQASRLSCQWSLSRALVSRAVQSATASHKCASCVERESSLASYRNTQHTSDASADVNDKAQGDRHFVPCDKDKVEATRNSCANMPPSAEPAHPGDPSCAGEAASLPAAGNASRVAPHEFVCRGAMARSLVASAIAVAQQQEAGSVLHHSEGQLWRCRKDIACALVAELLPYPDVSISQLCQCSPGTDVYSCRLAMAKGLVDGIVPP